MDGIILHPSKGWCVPAGLSPESKLEPQGGSQHHSAGLGGFKGASFKGILCSPLEAVKAYHQCLRRVAALPPPRQDGQGSGLEVGLGL